MLQSKCIDIFNSRVSFVKATEASVKPSSKGIRRDFKRFFPTHSHSVVLFFENFKKKNA